MGLFSNTLSSGESLFRDEMALDYDYLPKLLPYREKEQHFLASSIKPLLQKRPGKNILISGAPGIGKTAATRFVLRDLEEETDSVHPIYVNCWQSNTSFKIFTQICEDLDFRFIQNKKTDELFGLIKEKLNKSSAVFVFDEIDKAEDFDFLYMILEGIFRRSIILITNYKEWIIELDQRIKSRLTPEMVEFKEYNYDETLGILKQRSEIALAPGILEQGILEMAAKKADEIHDVRSGLYLVREATLIAENASLRKVTQDHMQRAIKKLDEFSVKKTEDLTPEDKFVLQLVKNSTGGKIGDLFKRYGEEGGKLSYKTFQRTINKLGQGGFILKQTMLGGAEGSTTVVQVNDASKKEGKEEKPKTLTDFSSADEL